MAIIAIPEFRDRLSHLFDIPEDAPMNGLFFQGSVESFGNTMGLRFGNEGKAGGWFPRADRGRQPGTTPGSGNP